MDVEQMEDRPAWTEPEFSVLDLQEVEELADLDVAFATYCCAHTADL